MWAIARYTGKEFLRKKIVYVVVLIAFLLLLSTAIAGSLALSEQAKIVQDMGLAVIEMCGLIMTLFFGSYLISHEISQGTIFLLLSKNIKRVNIIRGKYVGFALVLLLLRIIVSVAFFGVSTLYHVAWNPLYPLVLVGILFSRLLTLALVIFFSTFVSPFVALFASLIVYLLGHMMSFVVYYVTVLKAEGFGPIFVRIMKGVYYILPNYTLISLQEFLNVPNIERIAQTQFLS